MEEAKLPPLPALEPMTERVEVWALMQEYGRECARLERERFIAVLRECPDTVYRDLTIEAIRNPKS